MAPKWLRVASASPIGSDAPASALDIRLTELKPLSDAVILRDIELGMTTASQTVRMDFDQNMGELYPFSLEQKLKVITEPSPYYAPESAGSSPWGRAIIPMEMLSVLFQHGSKKDRLPVKGPAVGLFADQEIRLLLRSAVRWRRLPHRPQGRRDVRQQAHRESVVRTEVFDSSNAVVATMLLNLATPANPTPATTKSTLRFLEATRSLIRHLCGSRAARPGQRASAIRQNYLEM